MNEADGLVFIVEATDFLWSAAEYRSVKFVYLHLSYDTISSNVFVRFDHIAFGL